MASAAPYQFLGLARCVIVYGFIFFASSVSADYWALNQTFKICTSSWAPFVFVRDDGSHSGYDYDLFISVARRMAMNYTLRETPSWDAMLTGLTLPPDDPEHCDIAPTGLPWDDYAFASTQMTTQVEGIQLSIPTFRGGFGIATRARAAPHDMWSFTRVFSEELWAAIVCGSLFLAFIVYVSERNFHDRGMGKTHYPLEFKGGMYEAFYRVFGKLWNVVSDLNVVSIISKIISLAWGVATIVLIANYTASLAGYLTAERVELAVNSVEELQKLPGITYAAAADRVNSGLGLNLSSFYWMTDQDGLDALNKVRTGQYAAMVMDKPWLRYYTANLCDIKILDLTLLPNYLGWGLNKYMPQWVINEINSQLLSLQEEGLQELVESAYLPVSTCSYQDLTITFSAMAGLWVIMGASLGLSLMLLLLPHLSKKFELDVSSGARTPSVTIAKSLVSVLRLHSLLGNSNKLHPDPSNAGGSQKVAATAGAAAAAAVAGSGGLPDSGASGDVKAYINMSYSNGNPGGDGIAGDVEAGKVLVRHPSAGSATAEITPGAGGFGPGETGNGNGSSPDDDAAPAFRKPPPATLVDRGSAFMSSPVPPRSPPTGGESPAHAQRRLGAAGSPFGAVAQQAVLPVQPSGGSASGLQPAWPALAPAGGWQDGGEATISPVQEFTA